jgi:hypothetical protein
VLSASDRRVSSAVRAAIHAGARGYALKNEPADQIRSAIKEVAAGRDWISPRLAYIFATDDAADRPPLSHQERRVLQLYGTGLPLKSVARRWVSAKKPSSNIRDACARNTQLLGEPHQLNWSCIIVPSKTDTSHPLFNHPPHG